MTAPGASRCHSPRCAARAVAAASAARIRGALRSVIDDLAAASGEGDREHEPQADGSVPVDVLIGFYSPSEEGG